VAVAAAIVIKFKGAITKQLMGENGEGGVLGNVFEGVNSKIKSDLN
jgi:hypothetical protein